MTSYFTLNHILEIPAVIFGVANVFLAARANLWNFLFGFLMCAIYFILDLRVKIYADMTLQLIFIAFQFYGWYQWTHGKKHDVERKITYAGVKWTLLSLLVAIIIFAVYAFILHNYTDSTLIPFDASATALSIVAQFMMSKKWVENWWLWIVIDILSIVMYGLKDLYFTAGLYTLLLGIAIYGAIHWHLSAKKPSLISTVMTYKK